VTQAPVAGTPGTHALATFEASGRCHRVFALLLATDGEADGLDVDSGHLVGSFQARPYDALAADPPQRLGFETGDDGSAVVVLPAPRRLSEVRLSVTTTPDALAVMHEWRAHELLEPARGGVGAPAAAGGAAAAARARRARPRQHVDGDVPALARGGHGPQQREPQHGQPHRSVGPREADREHVTQHDLGAGEQDQAGQEDHEQPVLHPAQQPVGPREPLPQDAEPHLSPQRRALPALPAAAALRVALTGPLA
jgi:hypothetical protein